MKNGKANHLGRVVNVPLIRSAKIRLLVGEKQRQLTVGKLKQNNWRIRHGMGDGQFSICSQCNKRMKKSLADKQIENKRENAPICQACIMGFPRKIAY